MPRWYRRDPSRLRDARRPLSKAAGDTLSELLDFVGVEGTMPGEVVVHGGVVVTAEQLAAELKLPVRGVREALVLLRDRGYVRAGEGRSIIATGGLIDLLPPPDTARERKERLRERSDGVPENVPHDVPRNGSGSVPPLNKEKRFRVPTLRSGTRLRAAWVEPIAEAVEALLSRELRSLSPDERYLLARWHAFAFANCSRSEPTNKSRSRSIAQGLLALAERLSRDDAKRDFRVGEYLKLGERLVVRSGGAPWYRPLDVEAEIVLEPA